MFIVDWSDPQTFWLNMTNAALGVIVAGCVLLIGYGVLHDVLLKMFRRRAAEADDHGLMVPELGFTMADGGEPVERRPEKE